MKEEEQELFDKWKSLSAKFFSDPDGNRDPAAKMDGGLKDMIDKALDGGGGGLGAEDNLVMLTEAADSHAYLASALVTLQIQARWPLKTNLNMTTKYAIPAATKAGAKTCRWGK